MALETVDQATEAPMREEESTPDESVDATVPTSNAQIESYLKQRVATSKTTIRQLFNEWKRNVDLRIGRIAGIYTGGVRVEDDIRTEINPDWALTKTKTANLYSQVPTVRGKHENKQYAAAMSPLLKQLNYELGPKRADIGVAMEEVLNDVVNASGVGGIINGLAARFEDVEVPAMDSLPGPQGPVPVASIPPQVLEQIKQAAIANGTPIPMKTVPRMVSSLPFSTRISPTDLLLPSEYMGSDYNKGPWVGRRGRCSWAEGSVEFKLQENQKQAAIGGEDPLASRDTLRSEPEKDALIDVQGIKFDELYYWRYLLDPNEKNFKAIWKLVFVHGIDKPVIHEPWKGQELQDGTYIGSCVFPIQILTLTYITDNPIPPSDSSAGRPQVNDMRRSRNQMFQNRERSIPIRWFDVNRIDPAIQDTLMRGTWQGMIPTNGDGSRTIGEIARASYPSEDLAFDQQTKQDLQETWQISGDQLGSPSTVRKTGTESTIQQQNFATRIGQERGRVAAFFLKCAEVHLGLIVINSTFPVLTDQEKQAMRQAWDSKKVTHDMVLSILPDSQVVLDSNARIAKLTQFLNITAKSGYVNVASIITEIAELTGLDPAEVMIQPQPKEPEPPNISYRFSGKDDLTNPMVVAMLIAEGKAPTKEQLKQAQELLQSVIMPQAPEPPAGTPAGGPEGAPGGAPPTPGGPTGSVVPHPADTAHPDWSIQDRIAKRSRDLSGGGD